MDQPSELKKLKRYIQRYTGERVDFRTAEWKGITLEQRRARLDNLKGQADRVKKQKRSEIQKKADAKFREQNLERRREQQRKASKKYREKKKKEKEEAERNEAARRILEWLRERKQSRLNNSFRAFITYTANFFYMQRAANGRWFKSQVPSLQTSNISLTIISKTINRRVVREYLLSYIEKLIELYINKIWKIDLLDFEFTFTLLEFKYTDEDMMRHRMLRVGAKNIDGYPDQTWLKDQGTCVFDYLQHRYQHRRGMKKRFSSYENINLMLNGIDPINPSEDDEDMEVEDFITEGVPTYGIHNLCKICGFCLYALHDDDKTFHHFKPPNYNNMYPTLMYRISNEHIYPVEDVKIKQSVIQIYELSTSSDIFRYESKKKLREEDTINIAEGNVEIIEGVEPIEYLANTIKEKKIPSKITYTNGQLKSFKINKVQYIFNQDVEYIRKLCKKLEIEYKGQGAVTMINYLTELALGYTMPKSCPNNLVNNTLIQAKMNRAHTGLIDADLAHLLDDPLTKAYDINKCYTYNLYNARDDWIILHFNDTWEDVVEFDPNNIKTGLYYVKTFDTMLFKRDNVYSNIILDKAVKEGIDFTVTKQLIPSLKEEKDLFVKIIKKIVEVTKGIVRDDGKPLYKYLNNMLSGLLGKHKTTHSKVNVNSNMNEILYALGVMLPNIDDTTIDKIKDTEYYIYGGHKHIQLSENNIPMYIQVLDASNVQLYDLMKAVGGQLIGRKVDCVAVYKPNETFEACDISYGKQWGQFQEADHIPIMINKERHNENKFVFSTSWRRFNVSDSADYLRVKDIIDKHKGLMIEGGPGVGKSYVAKKLAELLPRNVRIAPTNKAARNIGGKTIHRFLTISEEKRISPVHIKMIKRDYDVVIVDEISMISAELWQRLMLLKVAIPNLVFVLIGDRNQLPPVEPEEINSMESYFNHPAVKFLANNNFITLTKVYRYSLELKRHLDDILMDKEFNYQPYLRRGFTDTRYNICFFNKTRKAVNAYWNEKETPARYIHIFENAFDKYTQDINVYENLPVIARKTIKRGDICCNNELFTVADFDDESIHLYTIRDDEPHVIEVPISKFQDWFLMNYCCTVHKSQGETLSERITIYDWNSPKLQYFNKLYVKKIRYTGLSRIELKHIEGGVYELLSDKLQIAELPE